MIRRVLSMFVAVLACGLVAGCNDDGGVTVRSAAASPTTGSAPAPATGATVAGGPGGHRGSASTTAPATTAVPIPSGAVSAAPVIRTSPVANCDRQQFRDLRGDRCYSLGLSFPLDAVTAEPGRGSMAWTVTLTLTDDSMQGFNRIAAGCYERRRECPDGAIAIVVGDVVISAPLVQMPRFVDRIVIAGFDEPTAVQLADVLLG